MEILSSEYGWTPKQIKRQNRATLMQYWDILQRKKKIKQHKIKQKQSNG